MSLPTTSLWLALVFCLGALSGCKASHDAADAPATVTETAAVAPALPPLTLRDETPNQLLTWADAEGNFHVTERTSDVPEDRRGQVRVVLTDVPAGTGQTVYVADLTHKRPDGTYAVTTMPRAQWEKIGADRRKARLEALAPAKHAPDGRTVDGQAPGGVVRDGDDFSADPSVVGPPGAADLAGISAIIYGADWCKPCHDAERYLKSLGVAVTKKNVEESRAAQAEMQEKLVRVNRRGAGIPVIDVMGKILVGYSPGSLKQAVDAARGGKRQRQG